MIHLSAGGIRLLVLLAKWQAKAATMHLRLIGPGPRSSHTPLSKASKCLERSRFFPSQRTKPDEGKVNKGCQKLCDPCLLFFLCLDCLDPQNASDVEYSLGGCGLKAGLATQHSQALVHCARYLSARTTSFVKFTHRGVAQICLNVFVFLMSWFVLFIFIFS